jgi:hypothetical protein
MLPPPKIAITSPARGSFQTQMATMVQGVVTAPAGLTAVMVQGQPVTFSPNGAFSEAVPLTPGMNTIVVQGFDKNHKSVEESLSIIAGNFAPDTQPIANAIGARLNPGAFAEVGKLAATIVTPQILAQQITAKQPLFSSSIHVLFFSIPTTVSAPAASVGQPAITLTPQNGSIHLHVEIPSVNIATKVHTGGLIPLNLSGNMTADKMILDTDIAISLTNGVLSTQIVNTSDSFQNFDIGFNHIPDFITDLLLNTIQKMVRTNLADQVHTLVQPMVDSLLSKVSTGVTQNVLGLQLTVSLQPTQASVDPTGFTLMTGSNVTILPANGYQPLPAPGSFVTNGTPPALGTSTTDFALTANEDFLNRVGYEAWHAGVTDITVDAQSPLLKSLPPFLAGALDTDLLLTFMPNFQGKVQPHHPISFVLSPKLPAIFQAGAAPDPIDAAIGELEISIYDAATSPPTLILTFAVHTRVHANATLSPDNKVSISVGPNMFFDVSLAGSPLVPDLNLTSVTNLINVAVPPLVQIGSGFLPAMPLPIPSNLAPKTIGLTADGAQQTFLTIKGGF